MTRQDTRLESVGAEFLVLGQLLIHRIASYKTYTNMPGYDLVATDPANNTSTRIQVKSRWKTGAPGFLINNFECDFVVVVKLNRGRKDGTGEVKDPEFLVFPAGDLERVPRTEGWGRMEFSRIPNLGTYRNRWDMIADFLAASPAAKKTPRNKRRHGRPRSGRNAMGAPSARPRSRVPLAGQAE